jgi:hypothetical protein
LSRTWSKTAQTILPHSKVQEMLGELHGRPLEQHLCAKKTLVKVRLGLRTNAKRWCQPCDNYTESQGPKTQARVYAEV